MTYDAPQFDALYFYDRLMAKNLYPCPFCDGSTISFVSLGQEEPVAIQAMCQHCGARGAPTFMIITPQGRFHDVDSCTYAWNSIGGALRKRR